MTVAVISLLDLWGEAPGDVLYNHAHLCGTVHVRGHQWLPLYLLQVCLGNSCHGYVAHISYISVPWSGLYV